MITGWKYRVEIAALASEMLFLGKINWAKGV